MWFKCPICDKVLYKTVVSSVEEENEDDVCEDLKNRPAGVRIQVRPGWNTSNTTSSIQANPPVPWRNKIGHKGKPLDKAELKIIKDEASRKAAVATKCGHVFHKECLYKYMRAYRMKFRESSIECPVCESRVLCAGTYILDLEAHDERGHQADSEISVIRLLHSELVDQTKAISKKLMDVELQIRFIKTKRVLERAEVYGRPNSHIVDQLVQNFGNIDRGDVDIDDDEFGGAQDDSSDSAHNISRRFSSPDTPTKHFNPSLPPSPSHHNFSQMISCPFSPSVSLRPQSPPPLSSTDSII